MTKSGLPNNRMVCRYCGLETAVFTNHAATHECVEALQREVNRLREHLLRRRPSDTAVSQPTSDRDNAGAMSPDTTVNVPNARDAVESSEPMTAVTAAGAIDVAADPDQSSLKRASRLACRQAEMTMITRMLQQTRGNRRQAAINLGISYKALLYKAKEHGLSKIERFDTRPTRTTSFSQQAG